MAKKLKEIEEQYMKEKEEANQKFQQERKVAKTKIHFEWKQKDKINFKKECQK